MSNQTTDILSKATPRPWRAEGWNNLIVNGADGITLALAPGGGSVDTARENAALIVRAVNAFYPMLDALRPLAAWAEMERRRHNAADEENEAAYMGELADAARAALALADGKDGVK